MGEGEPGVGPNSLKGNPMTIKKGEVMVPPFFYSVIPIYWGRGKRGDR
jgi:hypothetical protein